MHLTKPITRQPKSGNQAKGSGRGNSATQSGDSSNRTPPPQQPDQQPHQQLQQQPDPPQPAAEQQRERAEAQTEVQGTLFVNEEAIERARAVARDDGKKAQLPEPIPGFKASMLDIAILPKADEAFKVFRYMPYMAISLSAQIKASRGEGDFVVNAQGGLTAKGLDCRNERGISTIEW
ncbi:hypothetical protein JB92DRAFT_3116646 [Gautieria morchelliformis]|nr:hypothetical protein JB92DRAFT_3116646 [Gautieria morchelliformis]